jgi:hypothetical protein
VASSRAVNRKLFATLGIVCLRGCLRRAARRLLLMALARAASAAAGN